MTLLNADAALKAGWQSTVEIMAMRVTPRETLVPQKAAPFELPAVRERSEVFAVGQPRTVDEMRKTFAPTMQLATGPVTRELDKRTGMPDVKPEALTPSR